MKIDVAKDFSLFPFGRYKAESETSGERFRDELLLPALENGKNIEIHLDGVADYGASFLEETFGGLIRLGFTKEYIYHNIILVTENEDWRHEIEQYIDDETARNK